MEIGFESYVPTSGRRHAARVVLGLLVLSILCSLLLNLIYLPCKARPQLLLTQCKSNLKELAARLDDYRQQHRDHYPRALNQLALKTSYEYQPSSDLRHYSLVCSGHNHREAYRGFDKDCRNYPYYDSDQGLIDHP